MRMFLIFYFLAICSYLVNNIALKQRLGNGEYYIDIV